MNIICSSLTISHAAPHAVLFHAYLNILCKILIYKKVYIHQNFSFNYSSNYFRIYYFKFARKYIGEIG